MQLIYFRDLKVIDWKGRKDILKNLSRLLKAVSKTCYNIDKLNLEGIFGHFTKLLDALFLPHECVKVISEVVRKIIIFNDLNKVGEKRRGSQKSSFKYLKKYF